MEGQNRGYTKSLRTTTAIILLSWPNLILWLQKLSESDRVVEAFDVSTAAWQSGISVVFSDKKVLKKAGEKNCYYNCKITGENSNLTTTTKKYYILVIIIHLLEKNIILLTYYQWWNAPYLFKKNSSTSRKFQQKKNRRPFDVTKKNNKNNPH